ncbi:conserved Plasmodium protein, unknown function [Plasmodium gallinaceum]|uniref:Uncharacterized protein n=1 Tax=Plasmodium gallinaceum TaxID=5849 RepID=A0A1J1GX42_PLAGA|nr:conserved Plasmodium protein, unknown function [Plasmodium gallinaceum]CRG97039.1 conserved Plasmodium protein, unknown function [Plasmodium gallinaceum]
MEKQKFLNILERELKEYGDDEMLLCFHKFYKSIEENEMNVAEKVFREMIYQMKKFFIIYDKRNKSDLIEKIKNSLKEESNEVNIINIEKENDTKDNIVDEDIHYLNEEGNRNKFNKHKKYNNFKNHYSFLSTDLFNDINLKELEKNVYNFDIFHLYNINIKTILEEKEENTLDEKCFYETFQYFLNLLCLLYFFKNIYFDLIYKTNENSYSFLFKGFEERKNKVINYFFLLKKLRINELIDNEIIKIYCNFFQYIYINEYLIRNIFDITTNSFIYTCVKNFQSKYKIDIDNENNKLQCIKEKNDSEKTFCDESSLNNILIKNMNNGNNNSNNNKSNNESIECKNKIDNEHQEKNKEIGEYKNKEYDRNCMNDTLMLRKINQEDFLNKELNNFFVSNNANKVNKNSFIEIIYENENYENIYSDEIINSLFYFFNNPYLIFTFHKNVLFYIEKKSKDKTFFQSNSKALALIKYLNHSVITISRVFHIFICAGLFFNKNIMKLESNKYLNFYKLLNYGNFPYNENYENNNIYDKNEKKKNSINVNSLFNHEINVSDSYDNNSYEEVLNNQNEKNPNNLKDTNFYEIDIIKYLMKYKDNVSNFSQGEFSKEDYSDSNDYVSDESYVIDENKNDKRENIQRDKNERNESEDEIHNKNNDKNNEESKKTKKIFHRLSDEYNLNHDAYQKTYTNKSIFNDILEKAKTKKAFYEFISKINKLKNSFDINDINKNKSIDTCYIENIDTISYFISIYNSDYIFQFDYFFLKFVAEITSTYNNYIKSYLMNSNDIKSKKEELDKTINRLNIFLNEIIKLIYVYTWCLLYIFGHSYSYVKYAKYFYQKRSFFVLENKDQFIFNNFNYFTQEASNSSDLYMKSFYNPSNIVENLKYNYELKDNKEEFENFNFNNFLHIYKKSYFQNIVDKLHLNLKFIENILFTMNTVFKNKINKKKNFIDYLCIKDQKLEDIYNSIENLKSNIIKYKKTFHYCLNFNNIKNVIILALEEMNMSSDKLELNKLLNEYLNKLESKGQLKKKQKKINVKIINNNIILDTNKKKKKDEGDNMDDDINKNYMYTYMQMKKISNNLIKKKKRTLNRNNSDSSSECKRNNKKKKTFKKNVSFDNNLIEKNQIRLRNITFFTDNDCYNKEEMNKNCIKNINNCRSVNHNNSDYNKLEVCSDNDSLENENKYYDSSDYYNDNKNNNGNNICDKIRFHEVDNKSIFYKNKNKINEDDKSDLFLNCEYNTERLTFFFNLLNGNTLFYYLSLHFLVKNEQIMEILHFLPLKYLLDLLVLYDLKDYIKFKTIIRVFRIIYEFQDFSPILKQDTFFNKNNYSLGYADFMNYEFSCKFLTIDEKNEDKNDIMKKDNDDYNDKNTFLSHNKSKKNYQDKGKKLNIYDQNIMKEKIVPFENKKEVKGNLMNILKSTFSVFNFSKTLKSYPLLLKDLLNKILMNKIGKCISLGDCVPNKEYNNIKNYSLNFIYNNLQNISFHSNTQSYSYKISTNELYNISIHNFILYHLYELAIRTKELIIKSSCFKLIKYLLTEYYYYPDIFNEKCHELINSNIKLNDFYIKNVILDFVSFNIMICHLQKELTSNLNVLNNLDLFNYSLRSIANYLIGYQNNSFFFLIDKKKIKTLLIKLTYMIPFIYKLKIPACVIRLYIRVIKSLDKEILDMINNLNKIDLIYDSLFYIIISHFIYFFLNLNIELDEEASNLLSCNFKSSFSLSLNKKNNFIKIINDQTEEKENLSCENDKLHQIKREEQSNYLRVDNEYNIDNDNNNNNDSSSSDNLDDSNDNESNNSENYENNSYRSKDNSKDDNESNKNKSNININPNNFSKISNVLHLRKIIVEKNSFNLENNYFKRIQ